MDNIDKWIQENKNDSNIINIFSYGSYVYGTNDSASDKDYICIIRNKSEYENNSQKQFTDGDITFYTDEYFHDLLSKHEISAIECLWNEDFVLNKKHQQDCIVFFNEQFNLSDLRRSISSKSSNSWVKSKKKLTLEKDYNYRVGIKSLFHSIRILCFGWQIGCFHKIVNYSMCNNIWDGIKKDSINNDYTYLKKKYQPIYNEWHHKFVLIAPK